MTIESTGSQPLSEIQDSPFLLELKPSWLENLGFDPFVYGVDIVKGTVDDKHIGRLSAVVCAISRHDIREHITANAPAAESIS